MNIKVSLSSTHILEFKKEPFIHFHFFSGNAKFNPIQNRIPFFFIRFCMSLCKWNRRNDWILNLFICCWFAFLCSSSETQFKYHLFYEAFSDSLLMLINPYLWYFYLFIYILIYTMFMFIILYPLNYIYFVYMSIWSLRLWAAWSQGWYFHLHRTLKAKAQRSWYG